VLFRSPLILRWLYPSLTWRIPTNKKELYLTFDDGPVSGPTDFVLEELARHEVKATFFCIGNNVVKHPQLFQNIIINGHTVANHTYDHINGWRYNAGEYEENVSRCSDVTNNALLFRPPYGKIKWSQVRRLSSYKIIMWDVLSFDFSKNVSPEKCLSGSIGATRPGSIIVFHDSYKAEKNLKFALPKYLDHFIGMGFEFKTLDPF
jgi:peptidoglycan/xylan/chitin deacetylase (PgdA/CDA1 family)